MKEIKLRKMNIQNFKGIKSREIEFNDEVTIIAGQNEAGKTTVSDAFFWCLFGKNAEFDSKFGVKPLDADNNPIHNIETSVYLDFDIDGQHKSFKRTMTEKWGKKHGDSDETLTGHDFSYYVDDVPTKAGEYSESVNNVCNEDDFKILSSYSYFNEKLHWQERRKMLSALVDGVTLKSIAEKRKYSSIRDDVMQRGVYSSLMMLKDRISKLNRDEISFQARIDQESTHIISSDIDTSRLEKERNEIKDQIEMLRKQSMPVESDEVSKLRSELKSIQHQIGIAELGIAEKLKTSSNAGNDLEQAKYNLEAGKFKSKQLSQRLEECKSYEDSHKKMIVNLRESYMKLQAKEFTGAICPTCGQELPEDQLNDKKVEWVQSRNDRLVELAKKASHHKNLLKENKAVIAKILTDIADLRKIEFAKKIDDCEKKLSVADKELAEALRKRDSLMDRYKAIRKQIGELAMANVSEDISEQISRLQERFDDISKQLAAWDESEKAKASIKKLSTDRSESGALKVVLEGRIALLNELKLDYIQTIDNDLNRLFGRNVKVKLFDMQLNGGFKETCEILVKSKDGALVPYGDANTAGRINAGLEVILVISHLKGIRLPLWIDHAESVGNIANTGSQQIHLKFMKTYRQLTII